MGLSEDAKAFFFKGNNEGCLLIHGFTGSAGHMRPLGEYLNNKGYTVFGVLLKGHGTSVEDMESTSYHDWIKSAVDGYEMLKRQCDRVYVMGLSMGGILSLYLAEKYNVDKVISIASPIKIHDPLAKWTPLLKYFKRFNKWSSSNPEKKESTKEGIGYNIIPLKCVPELLKVIKVTRKSLNDIKCPLLVIQPKLDKYVKLVSSSIIYNGASSTQKKQLWLNNSPHGCTLGPEKELIHYSVFEFIKLP
ncbi:alpha/beta hydrolase [Alkaliphilus peptidifermentans]|uniref:Carboxylesterase n=1 Tax=Alkaliphilus peptidifermentans DSM 18978 TaxID=1120976 RepID=A0A1G5JGT6_9FIRM|nr:alpha/beta fold hydrolase [Alkaliphilus peptidifermentans]SCY87120.1 carboxylesterase [Alkaliphilus peptidifermentans DSM 18978]